MAKFNLPPPPVLIVSMAVLFSASHCTIIRHLSAIQRTVDSQIAYDMDLVRRTFLEEARFLHAKGCHEGADRKPTPPVAGFDTNTVAHYCSKKTDGWEEYILYKAVHLGKRP